MDGRMSKAALLDALHTERARWETLLAEVGDARMTEPGVEGEWSVKDVVAHVTAYERWIVGELGGATRRDPPPPPEVDMADVDQRNAWFHRQDRDRTLRDVLAEAERVFGQLLALTQARSEGELRALYSLAPEGALRPAAESETPAPWPLWKWIANMSLEHYPQHIAPLRAWLDRHDA